MFDLPQMLALTERRDGSPYVLSAALGLLTSSWVERSMAMPCTLGHFVDRVTRAVALNQLKFYFDRFGRYCGHVWWTQVSPSVEPTLLRHGPDQLASRDFSAKGSFWLLDAQILFGELRAILADMYGGPLAAADKLTYFRYKRGRRLAKRVSRENTASLFQRSGDARSASNAPVVGDDDLRYTAGSIIDQCVDLGMILRLLGSEPAFRQTALPKVWKAIQCPLELRQYKLLCSAEGEPWGFYSWAWLDAEDRPSNSYRPLGVLAAHEWNEGMDLALCHAIASPEGVEELLYDVAHRWYPEERVYLYPTSANDEGLTMSPPFSWSERRELANDCLRARGADPVDVLSHLRCLRGDACTI